jgi:hypothetical protein
VGPGATQIELAQWVLPGRTAPVFAREGASTRIPNLILMRAGIIAVRVVDKATKKGLPFVEGSFVRLADQKQALTGYSLQTDARGRAAASIVPGKVHVSLRIGYPPNSRRKLLKVGESWYDSPLKPGKVIRYNSDLQNISQVVEVEKGKRREVVFEMERVDKGRLNELPARR